MSEYQPKTGKRCCVGVSAHQWSIRPTCHPARSLQLIGIRPIRSGAIIAHECDRKQARDPTFITGRRSFFSWRRTGTIIRRVMAELVMEGGMPHCGSPSRYNQHRVIKIANSYTYRSTVFCISARVTFLVYCWHYMRKYYYSSSLSRLNQYCNSSGQLKINAKISGVILGVTLAFYRIGVIHSHLVMVEGILCAMGQHRDTINTDS